MRKSCVTTDFCEKEILRYIEEQNLKVSANILFEKEPFLGFINEIINMPLDLQSEIESKFTDVDQLTDDKFVMDVKKSNDVDLICTGYIGAKKAVGLVISPSNYRVYPIYISLKDKALEDDDTIQEVTEEFIKKMHYCLKSDFEPTIYHI